MKPLPGALVIAIRLKTTDHVGQNGTIIGVIADYHQSSMHTPIEPFMPNLVRQLLKK